MPSPSLGKQSIMERHFSENKYRDTYLQTLYKNLDEEVKQLDSIIEETKETKCTTGSFDVELQRYIAFKRAMLLRLVQLIKS